MAILAGFEQSPRRVVITLDADLQNPPEEIGKLRRQDATGPRLRRHDPPQRQDSLWRRNASRAMNRLRERITRIQMTDQGCMLRAYSRDDRRRDQPLRARSTPSFRRSRTPSRTNPTEIEVEHEERAPASRNTRFYRLIRLNFDLMTGFSLVPLQLFSMLGMLSVARVGGAVRAAADPPLHHRRRGARACSRCSPSPSS